MIEMIPVWRLGVVLYVAFVGWHVAKGRSDDNGKQGKGQQSNGRSMGQEKRKEKPSVANDVRKHDIYDFLIV